MAGAYLAAFWIFSPPRSMSLPMPEMVLQAAKFRAKAAAMEISKKRMMKPFEKMGACNVAQKSKRKCRRLRLCLTLSYLTALLMLLLMPLPRLETLMPTFSLRLLPSFRVLLLSLGLAGSLSAHAGLFDDNEARQAILDLRAEVKQLHEVDIAKLAEQNSTLQRSLLDLQAQIEQLKQSNAQQTGRLEELENRINTAASNPSPAEKTAEAQPPATDTGISTHMGGGVQVKLDGQNLEVSAEEKRQFDASLALFQAGNFAGAERALTRLAAQNPSTAYAPWLHYWVGNSQFAQKRYAPAVESFKRVISLAPSNPKAPEAALSIANCQSQLGQAAEAKRTLENLTKVYPRSEAADSARERLARGR